MYMLLVFSLGMGASYPPSIPYSSRSSSPLQAWVGTYKIPELRNSPHVIGHRRLHCSGVSVVHGVWNRAGLQGGKKFGCW